MDEAKQPCEICRVPRPKSMLGVAYCVDGKGREIVRCNDNDNCRKIAQYRAVQSRTVVEKGHTLGDLQKLTDRAALAHQNVRDAARKARSDDGA